jgi:hypothetical protein
MKIDNPNHPEHLRYQRIVDRMLVTAFYIFATVGLSEVFNKPYYASALLLVSCTFLMLVGLYMSLLIWWFVRDKLTDLKCGVVHFYKGY